MQTNSNKNNNNLSQSLFLHFINYIFIGDQRSFISNDNPVYGNQMPTSMIYDPASNYINYQVSFASLFCL